MRLTKGQIMLTPTIAMAVTSFIAAPIIAYFSAQASAAKDISSVNVKVAVISANQTNIKDSLTQLQNTVVELNAKVDALLVSGGINPQRVLQRAQAINMSVPISEPK